MASQIDQMLKKYWEGKSTVQEEEELKQFFRKNPHLSAEGEYFRTIERMKNKGSEQSFSHPGKRIRRRWLSAAATVILGISVAFFVIQDARKQREHVIEDPKEAYEITRKALMMVSSGLNEGAEYSSEIKKINKAEEIVTQEEL